MNSEAFLSLYLKEIGVQAPISSFVRCQDSQLSRPQEIEAHDSVILEDMNLKEIVVESKQPAVSVMPATVLEVAEPAVVLPQESMKPAPNLQSLQQQAELCTACDLVHSRNKLVFGSGNPMADLVFIGDAPGREEDVAGLPFVESSGKLFDSMLRAIGVARDEVYLMNGVKCRPFHSRDPKPVEFSACDAWLIAQLDMIQPKMICLLGRVVAQSLLATDMSLSDLRQQQHSFHGIPLFVIDHPSYLLRSQQHKSRAWLDLCRLSAVYRKL